MHAAHPHPMPMPSRQTPWMFARMVMLILALMLQAIGSAAISVSGTMHRHTAPITDAAALQLVDFRRQPEPTQAHGAAHGHSHADAARHHHGSVVVDLVRTADDQVADHANEAAGDTGLAAPLALLPPAPWPLMPDVASPQVARTGWDATMHAPGLPERPPRTGDGSHALA